MNQKKVMLWGCAAPGGAGSQGPRSRAVLLICAALCLGAAFAVPAVLAQAGGACQADEQKLCPDMKPGSDELKACMKSHKDELSDACKQAMQSPKKVKKQSPARGAGACRADIRKYCPGMKVGSNELTNCMLENQAQLSKACKRMMRTRMMGLGSGAGQPAAPSGSAAQPGTPEQK